MLFRLEYHAFNYSDSMFAHSGFIKWSGRALSHPTLLATVLFTAHLGYYQTFEVCDHFIQLGVETALNLKINFGKFDI